MAFCRNCGQELNEDVQFCANCGTPVNSQSQQAQTEQIPPEQVQVATDADDVSANKGIAWLAYMGPLLLIPMFARKLSKYCQFHVRQGITVCAAAIAYGIITSILLLIIGLIFPGGYFLGYHYHSGVYNFFNIIFNLGYIFFTVISVIGIVNAATGKEKKLPVFGAITVFEPLMDKFYGLK